MKTNFKNWYLIREYRTLLYKQSYFKWYLPKGGNWKSNPYFRQNGYGKSSLLNIVFGNLNPKYKLIRLEKKPLLKPLYSKRIATYLQQYNFIPSGMKILFSFKLFHLDWADFTINFELFSIKINSKFGALSGGEEQLIETYIVFQRERKTVILDEPFSHLAP
jgi:ABC-type cobalamin/Fe3+-siderophores transport system ATPase subunit